MAAKVAVRRGPKVLAGGEGSCLEERFFVHFDATDSTIELPTQLFFIEAVSMAFLTAPDALQFLYLAETNSLDGTPVPSTTSSVTLTRAVTTSAMDCSVILYGR